MIARKVFGFFTAILALFCLAGNASAANVVTINPNNTIEPRSSCSLTGAISIEMDLNTKMEEGDIIRFVLPDDTSICGEIDYYLRLTDATVGGATGDGNVANTPGDPVQVSGNGESAFLVQNFLSDESGSTFTSIGFHVQGNDGQHTLTMTLGRRATDGTFTVETDAGATFDIQFQGGTGATNDVLTIDIFNGNTNTEFFFGPDAYGYYTNSIQETDNHLCIDNTNYASADVTMIPDSVPVSAETQITFQGDFIVQQAVDGIDYQIQSACKDDVCNYIPLVNYVNQTGRTIYYTDNVDFGDYQNSDCYGMNMDRWIGSGFCGSDSGSGNAVLIYKNGAAFDEGDRFTITLTVRAGTSADINKVYFANTDVKHTLVGSNDYENCDCYTPGSTGHIFSTANWSQVGGSDGNDATALEYTISIGEDESDNNAILLDLPEIALERPNLVAGEKIYVDVQMQKLPCGSPITTQTICFGELVSNDCPGNSYAIIDGIVFIGDRNLTDVLHGYLGRIDSTDSSNLKNCLFFPYAPAVNDESFFTGIAITNRGEDMYMIITITDRDGGKATYYSETIPAGSMWINTLDGIADDFVDYSSFDMNKPVNISVTALVY